MSASKEYKIIRNFILNELHITKEDIIKNIEPLLEKLVKQCMNNTYGNNNQIEHWIRCMVNDELKQKEGYGFVRKICGEVIKDHVLNNLDIIVRSKNERCTCENRVPLKENKKESINGLYLIYEDRHVESFTGENNKDGVKYVGLKHENVSFAISLVEHDGIKLVDYYSCEEYEHEIYYKRECDAIFDFDGQKNTEQLVARNPKLKNILEDGEYIPSLGQLNLMMYYKDSINDVLECIDAELLDSTECYWSSTEYDSGCDWYVHSHNGSISNGNKYYSGRVRTVIDF